MLQIEHSEEEHREKERTLAKWERRLIEEEKKGWQKEKAERKPWWQDKLGG